VSRLYDELAEWWPLLSPPEDYAREAEGYARALIAASRRPVRAVLELGSGGGNNASFLKRRFEMTLADRAPAMLRVSRALNPECEHVEGDMRSVRLGRRFDAVFINDAIAYATSEDDLRRVFATAREHLELGGAALFAPDHVRETFRPGTDHGGVDRGERGMRYLEWTHDPDPNDSTYLVDFAFLLREGRGEPRVLHERHELGLYSSAEWLRWLAQSGFEPRAIPRTSGAALNVSREFFTAVRNE
jgi:SAM-dependent methyltransferase